MTTEIWAPACMSPDELAAWRGDGLPYGGMTTRDVLPCHDCLRDFADEMRALGRCNGIPRGTEGVMEITREVEFDPTEVAERTAASRMRGRDAHLARLAEAKPDLVGLVAETPCASCLHAPVCARKRALDAIGDVPVRLPELEAGLTLTLRAVVECDAYLRAPKRFTPEGLARVQEANRAAAERRRAAKAAGQA